MLGYCRTAWRRYPRCRCLVFKVFVGNPQRRSPTRTYPPTYMLVRAIGNALPPRHDPARSLQNLRFTLEYERLKDDELSTHWLLNRLADEEVAQ